jgi:SAM-dependent methyltransferase
MKVFDQYARYYDLLYRGKDYQAETDFVRSLLGAYAPSASQIFEMGCGTGIHARMLVEAGYHIHGIDFSEAMLTTAVERREELSAGRQERLSFSIGDVRTYRAGRTFDVALSLFHVFSYQNTNADLRAAFATASAHLDAGGVFIFDYWYGPAVLAQRPETRIKRLRDGDLSILRIAEPRMDDLKNLVEVSYETIVKAGGEYDIRESHCMRYLFVPEIELLASIYGFEPVSHREWLGEKLPSANSWSAFSVLRKQ